MTAQENPTIEPAPVQMTSERLPSPALAHQANHGQIYCGDSLQLLRNRKLFKPSSVNLIMTSPNGGLVRKKEYGI